MSHKTVSLSAQAKAIQAELLKLDNETILAYADTHQQGAAKAEKSSISQLLTDGLLVMRFATYWGWKSGTEKYAERAKAAGRGRAMTGTDCRLAVGFALLALNGFDCSAMGGEHVFTSFVRRVLTIDKGDKNSKPKFFLASEHLDAIKSIVDGTATYKDEKGEEHKATVAHLADDAIELQLFPLNEAERKAEAERTNKEKLAEKRMVWSVKGMTQERVEGWYAALSADDKKIVNAAMAKYIVATIVDKEDEEIVKPTRAKRERKAQTAGK